MRSLTRFVGLFIVLLLSGVSVLAENIVIENDNIKYAIDKDGRNLQFTDKISGIDYLNSGTPSYVASVMREGKEYFVSSAALSKNILSLAFGSTGVKASILINKARDRITLEVISLAGAAEALTFINIPLTVEGMPDDPFAACVLSMNVRTHVFQLPALQTHLRATCYQRFGFPKAKITLLGLPRQKMLPVIRDVIKNAKDLPHSNAGGAWAQLSKEGYGSYLMNFGTLTEETVDEWINMCSDVGFNQIDNHGGGSFFKFGDFELDRKKWPEGWNTFKRINKRLHDKGISSIFHTYAFFIDKNSKYVTPVPNEDLGYFKSFTIAEPATPEQTEIAVKESTGDISLTTGFFVRNSLTLRIGKELVEFSGVTKSPPYKFTGCKRGANGTTASAHLPGDTAYHLREMFGRFVPGAESKLFTDIAKHTAQIVDDANFDGIYFDAIDGSDILAGQENFWYYGSKFVLEVARHLKKPVGMEMSSMIHLWWHYRSRWQAWDRPVRGYKRFIDIHSASIKSQEYEHGLFRGHAPVIDKLSRAENGGLLLPLQLGWWGHQTWNPPQVEPTFPDDIEYLGAKMIGNNAGLSMVGGFDKKTIDENPLFKRLNAIIKQYEELRKKNYFNDSVRKLLREPGKEFTLHQEADGDWKFKPVAYQKHKVAGLDDPTAKWVVNNEFEEQPLKIRIEALMSVKRYNDPSSIILADMSRPGQFTNAENANGVSGELKQSSEKTSTGESSGMFTAKSSGASAREASWIKMEKKFDPWLNLEKNQALGVWVKGDGSGQLLNFRIESPHHISHGARGDHYIKIDFTGWKYFELVEIESSEFSNYIWPAPYSSSSFFVYDSYRHVVDFNSVDKIQVWYNNIPSTKEVICYISPVKALQMVKASIENPSVIIGGEKIVFPVKLESGMYLEFKSESDCKLYGPKGEFIKDIIIQGKVPKLRPGNNDISFTCEKNLALNPRVQATIISEGKPL